MMEQVILCEYCHAPIYGDQQIVLATTLTRVEGVDADGAGYLDGPRATFHAPHFVAGSPMAPIHYREDWRGRARDHPQYPAATNP
jgi:hypothetical protein